MQFRHRGCGQITRAVRYRSRPAALSERGEPGKEVMSASLNRQHHGCRVRRLNGLRRRPVADVNGTQCQTLCPAIARATMLGTVQTKATPQYAMTKARARAGARAEATAKVTPQIPAAAAATP
eukprot:COSAG04_NODE_356_length_16034_cov_11.195168_5_plen_123_part_00